MTFQMVFFLAIELALIVSSFFLLDAGRERPVFHWAGTIFLCLTFCWSVWLGCALSFHQLTFRI